MSDTNKGTNEEKATRIFSLWQMKKGLEKKIADLEKEIDNCKKGYEEVVDMEDYKKRGGFG